MKKLFNNFTKGNDTQNKSSKSKRKFLKTFSFTSLALLMGIAGTMAFAPLGASPIVAGASEIARTSGLGLDPKNDFVIFSNEQGIDIRHHNTTIKDSSLGSYYFSMGMYNNLPVNWIIIGVASDVSLFTYEEFEMSTPAGLVISENNATHKYFSNFSNNQVVQSSEIPSGCILAISEFCLGTSDWANAAGSGTYTCYTDARLLRATMDTLYTTYFENYMSSKIVINTTFSPYSNKLFPLSKAHTEQFLTTNAMRITGQIDSPLTVAQWWTGTWSGWVDKNYQGQCYSVTEAGAIGAVSFWYTYNTSRTLNTLGVRPACILQL